MQANISEKLAGLRSPKIRLPSASIPLKDKIQAVRVVPRSDPKITPTVCSSSMMPEFTKPTSITVIADEDCMAIVIMVPTTIPISLLSVTFLSSFSNLPPVIFSREVDIRFIPKRKKASPPKSFMKA